MARSRCRRRLAACLAVVAIVATAACEVVPDPGVADLLPAGTYGVGATVERDVAYGPVTGCPTGDDVRCGGSQEVDIHRSPHPGPGPRPVIVWLHGGGWSAGDKSDPLPPNVLRQLDRGWDVVNANYRLAPWSRFPVPLLDAKSAVRWVKASAADRGWDPSRVVVAGHSAGGHLATLAAVTAGVPWLEPSPVGPSAAVDSSVAAAVSVNGVLDLDDLAVRHPFGRLMVMGFVGSVGSPDSRLATVRTHLDRSDPPLYLVQGKLDPFAPSKHAVDVCAAAQPLRLRCVMDLVDSGPIDGQGHDSGGSLHQRLLEEFLDRAGR
jgi:acetyl esterase/lipase